MEAVVDTSTPIIAQFAFRAAKSATRGCHRTTTPADMRHHPARSVGILLRDMFLHHGFIAHEATFLVDQVLRSDLEVAADIADNPVSSLTCFDEKRSASAGRFLFPVGERKNLSFPSQRLLAKRGIRI